ncbi:hypothetical protein V1460_12495 [Streptomyces sp. SCSIO 30461]|uniref:SCO0607 family lipoprotein n=1 Tax=Streptomyces sp. SCSIO 30461 TaxID=3118085 RepID=UPI0030D17E57
MNTPRPTGLAAASLPGSVRLAAAVLTSVAAVVALTGCSGWEYREYVCSRGEYPVLSVGGTGSACVSDGEEPPAGYARYPQGKVPQEVGDTWDTYWDTHTLDKDGKIIDAPEAG